VYLAQFVKGMHYSELDALARLDDSITVKQYGRDCFIYEQPDKQDIQAAQHGLEETRRVMSSGTYDIIILDEANIATHYNLFSVEDLLAFIDAKPAGVELVITGRRADERIIERADLVTEMKEIKHYFAKGVQARSGIEK